MDDDILLSWISEYVYCKRRFYLRYIECMDALSVDMIEGRDDHRVVDRRHIEKRGAHVTVSKLYVESNSYHIHGLCDNVEFDENTEKGVYIPYLNGIYTVTPVEFKHGKVRDEDEYDQQLCAQAFCLEEMYDAMISRGIIYYVDSKTRAEVILSDGLRQQTVQTICNIRDGIQYTSSGQSPDDVFPVRKQLRCKRCAMAGICNPECILVEQYMDKLREYGGMYIDKHR